MKITIESTSQMMTVNGVRCRIWEEETELLLNRMEELKYLMNDRQ